MATVGAGWVRFTVVTSNARGNCSRLAMKLRMSAAVPRAVNEICCEATWPIVVPTPGSWAEVFDPVVALTGAATVRLVRYCGAMPADAAAAVIIPNSLACCEFGGNRVSNAEEIFSSCGS